mgnify:FL=1
MRIGLMIYDDLEQATGGYLYDRMLVRELRRRGHIVNVLSLRQRSWPECIDGNDGIAVLSWMREHDILVQDELCHPLLFRPNLARVRPVVALVHNLSACLGQPVGSMERAYLESVDALVCTSHATLDACRSLSPGPGPAVVAHPGRDHLTPGPRHPGGEELRILHVGNIHPIKGLDVLLMALSRITDVPFRLEVAGAVADERFRRSLDGLMDVTLRGRVHFLGLVQAEGMCELYRTTDVLAVPSRYEGFGIALLEAMGFGIPVIAGREGGAGELVTHGRDGFLVSPNDHEAVARDLLALADDALREEMGWSARRRWEAHPTWKESLAVAVELIESMYSDMKGSMR